MILLPCPWVTFCSPAQSLLTCTLAHACSCLHTWHLPALTPVSLIHSSPYHDVCLSPYLIMFPIYTAFPLVVIAAALPYSYRLLPLLLMASVAVHGSWLHHISHLLDEALGIMTHARDRKCSQEGGTQLWSATWDDLMVFLHVIHVWSVWSSQLTKHEQHAKCHQNASFCRLKLCTSFLATFLVPYTSRNSQYFIQ